ncbi:MAG TPA: ABC transporter permease [Methylomirabilota bacterium]|jgi:ABC-type dipeptide/oligopeptide/nickel transport system permease subunit|nr:ABC transporter permease [Methylomirabilota bacterium]
MSLRLAAGAGLVTALILLAALAPLVAPHPPNLQDLAKSQQPPAWVRGGAWANPLGTDHLGRDVLSRIIYGSRVSLIVGAGGVALALTLGVVVGLFAGYARGWVDDVAMRLADVQLSLPYLLFVVAIVGVLGPSLRNVVLVFGVADFPLFARMARGETLRLRSAPFVEAAVASGASEARILLRHLLPNMAAVLVVVAAFEMAAMILYEAGVGFLGLSVPPMVPSWGNMLADGRSYLTTSWWIATFPGLAILAATLGINLVGDALRQL